MIESLPALEDLDDLVVSDRWIAAIVAKQLELLARTTVPDEDPLNPAGEYSTMEIAAVTRANPRHVSNRIELAHALTTRLPLTMAALAAGEINEYKARRVMTTTEVLSDDLAAQVEQRVIPHAGDCDTTQLNRRLRTAVAIVDPEGFAARTEATRAQRHLQHERLDDGAGLLTLQGDVERTQLAFDRTTAIARDLKTAGDDRTLDQIRADVALDCLAGKGFEQAKVQVWLTLPATTALGVDAQPGHLAGYGWLPAQRALELAAQQDATWQRVLTDPATGQVVDVGRNTYRPPAALRDHVRVTYPTCVGPGCTRPAHRCDLDHVEPFPVGSTTSANMRPLCRPHHNEKTHGGWRVEGSTWITKHGYRFPLESEPIVNPGNVGS